MVPLAQEIVLHNEININMCKTTLKNPKERCDYSVQFVIITKGNI